MGLASFIRENEEAIVSGWQEFAQTYLPAAAHLDRAALRDHIIGLLRFIAVDLETPETEKERSDKSKGQGQNDGAPLDGAAETHADLRKAEGFDTIEMISEFRALRASVIKLWRAEWGNTDDVLPDLLRFNEAIDQIMTESLTRFVTRFNDSESHISDSLANDIRDPLMEINKTAQLVLTNDKLDVDDARLVSQIAADSLRIRGFVSGMIEAAGAPLGRNRSYPLTPKDVGTSNQKPAPEVSTVLPKISR